MIFPFSIHDQLVLKKQHIANSTQEHILEEIKEALGYLRMSVRKSRENELFFHKAGIFGGFNKKDYLQNMFVSVEPEGESIIINIESNTTFLLIFFTLPLLILFFPNHYHGPLPPWLFSILGLLISFGLRMYVLDGVRKKLETHFVK